MRRIPWMYFGLIAGFIGAWIVDPGDSAKEISRSALWRQFAIVWFPIIGAGCGAALNVALLILLFVKKPPPGPPSEFCGTQ